MKIAALFACLLLIASPAPADTIGETANEPATDPELAARFARLALDCIHREYPNKIAHVFNSDADAGTPAQLYPVFHGCFDWHSSVHGHWLLLRLLRTTERAGMAPELSKEIEAALDKSFTPEGIAGEVTYFRGDNRYGFERPYGIAWFLQLTAELREWEDPRARRWLQTLMPLEAVIVEQIVTWLPKLAYPIRLGTHNQSMFAFGLILDWARIAGDKATQRLIMERSLAFHHADRDCPLAYEPSGEDFLSPCLMEADLMRRILPQAEFSVWLDGFLPDIPRDGRGNWLAVGIVNDPSDGKLVHLDGVNLSRAWNLQNVAEALPPGDARIASLRAASEIHARAGIASVSAEHYEGSHWLASFATYLVTRRGQAGTPYKE